MPTALRGHGGCALRDVEPCPRHCVGMGGALYVTLNHAHGFAWAWHPKHLGLLAAHFFRTLLDKRKPEGARYGKSTIDGGGSAPPSARRRQHDRANGRGSAPRFR